MTFPVLLVCHMQQSKPHRYPMLGQILPCAACLFVLCQGTLYQSYLAMVISGSTEPFSPLGKQRIIYENSLNGFSLVDWDPDPTIRCLIAWRRRSTARGSTLRARPGCLHKFSPGDGSGVPCQGPTGQIAHMVVGSCCDGGRLYSCYHFGRASRHGGLVTGTPRPRPLLALSHHS